MPECEDRDHHERKPCNIEIDCLGGKWDQIINGAVQVGVGASVPVVEQEEADDIESVEDCHEAHRGAQVESFQFSHSCNSERKKGKCQSTLSVFCLKNAIAEMMECL